jgi:hypothetical protein
MIIILAAGIFTGAGIKAIFSDVETSSGNTFTAGTLDLKVNNADSPVAHIEVGPIYPGWQGSYYWKLKNTGNLPGRVSIEFTPITNYENGMNEPEEIAEAQLYWGRSLGRDAGELGQYLSVTGGYYYPDPNRDWHEFITSRDTGPPVPERGITALGLDALGGKTYVIPITLGPGEEMGFALVIFLRNDLRAWDGCAYHDWIDDNVIQSDSVSFDIIFHLDQVSP